MRVPASRAWLKPILEILAGVPTVVYGYLRRAAYRCAAIRLARFARPLSASASHLSASSESALAAGLVMGVMIIPFISSMADDFHRRSAAGDARRQPAPWARRSRKPSAGYCLRRGLPGVIGGVLLAVSAARSARR